MSTVRLRGPVQVVRPKFVRVFDLIRSFPDQARLALGTRGVVWATAAGVVGLLCCAVSMASIALSLLATEAGYTRHRTADLLALDQSTRQLMHSVHLMTYDQLQPAEAEAALRKVWTRFEAALTEACDRTNSLNAARQPVICAEAVAMHELLAGEVRAFNPPSRLLQIASYIPQPHDHMHISHRMQPFADIAGV